MKYVYGSRSQLTVGLKEVVRRYAVRRRRSPEPNELIYVFRCCIRCGMSGKGERVFPYNDDRRYVGSVVCSLLDSQSLMWSGRCYGRDPIFNVDSVPVQPQRTTAYPTQLDDQSDNNDGGRR